MAHKKLFVSYVHTNKAGYGFGNATIDYPNPVIDGYEVGRLAELVKQDARNRHGVELDEVVIVNWQRMEAS